MADAASIRKMLEPRLVDLLASLRRHQVKEAVGLLLDYIDAQPVPAPTQAPKPSPSGHPDAEAFAMFTDFVRENAPALRLVAHWGDGHCGALHEVLIEQLQSNTCATVVQPMSNGGAADGHRVLAPLFPEDGGVDP